MNDMNESEETASPLASPPSPPLTGVGQQLSAAREGWGLSVEEAAQCLNLSSATIQALEEDAYQRLPGSTFAMGYLRSYAKLLKLDHEKILTRVRMETDQVRKIPYTNAPLKRPLVHGHSNKHAGWFVRILLFVGVLAGLIGFAISQLPGASMDKIMNSLGLSSISYEQKANGIPFSTSNDSAIEDSLRNTE